MLGFGFLVFGLSGAWMFVRFGLVCVGYWVTGAWSGVLVDLVNLVLLIFTYVYLVDLVLSGT